MIVVAIVTGLIVIVSIALTIAEFKNR